MSLNKFTGTVQFTSKQMQHMLLFAGIFFLRHFELYNVYTESKREWIRLRSSQGSLVSNIEPRHAKDRGPWRYGYMTREEIQLKSLSESTDLYNIQWLRFYSVDGMASI